MGIIWQRDAGCAHQGPADKLDLSAAHRAASTSLSRLAEAARRAGILCASFCLSRRHIDEPPSLQRSGHCRLHLPRKLPSESARSRRRDRHDFATSGLCNNTGICPWAWRALSVKVETTEPFRDGGIRLRSADSTRPMRRTAQQLALVLGVPLRRELTRPWFRLVLATARLAARRCFSIPIRNTAPSRP